MAACKQFCFHTEEAAVQARARLVRQDLSKGNGARAARVNHWFCVIHAAWHVGHRDTSVVRERGKGKRLPAPPPGRPVEWRRLRDDS